MIRNRNQIITLIFILVTIIIIIFALSRGNGSDAETTKCIASKSTLYVATGCSACAYQEKLFGDNFKYLNTIDCAVNPEKCMVIIENGYIQTPSWVINSQKIKGVQSIEKLKELTGC